MTLLPTKRYFHDQFSNFSIFSVFCDLIRLKHSHTYLTFLSVEKGEFAAPLDSRHDIAYVRYTISLFGVHLPECISPSHF